VHFSNLQCLSCSTELGYAPWESRFVSIEQAEPGIGDAGFAGNPCTNRAVIGCNWMYENTAFDLCLSCRHTTKTPDLSQDLNRAHWAKLERAKRRLFYALIKLRLPLDQNQDGVDGSLSFAFLADTVKPDGTIKRVMTGHADGHITVNIAEADDPYREKTRAEMGEPYRTLIGHLRHEVGHYYWQELIAGQSPEPAFRACFGDERQDYGDALKTHYAKGPAPDWATSFVSTYASAHPWEDFAETWAHYLHMVSGLETAYAYGINPQPLRPEDPRLVQLDNPFRSQDVEDLIAHWIPLTVAMNEMNRSIGNKDYYPFVLTPAILQKMQFVHDLIKSHEVTFFG
jgi:hypothetical protein